MVHIPYLYVLFTDSLWKMPERSWEPQPDVESDDDDWSSVKDSSGTFSYFIPSVNLRNPYSYVYAETVPPAEDLNTFEGDSNHGDP